MYVTVKQGDHLPSVALAQARLVENGAADLLVDGIFGPRTAVAVAAFQGREKLPVTNCVDQLTWASLIKNVPMAVVDVIDAAEIVVLEEDEPYLRDGHSHVMVNYGMSRGAMAIVERLVASEAPHSVALLRFHGHGNPGAMHVSGGWVAGAIASSFRAQQFRNPEAVAAYSRLGGIMKSYGSIELHGCNVAAGSRGHQLLSGMAGACAVPVTAGLGTQNGAQKANRFEGPVHTELPLGVSLKTWASRVFAKCGW
jgi:hypothetical protein